jgi:hypothetical protein
LVFIFWFFVIYRGSHFDVQRIYSLGGSTTKLFAHAKDLSPVVRASKNESFSRKEKTRSVRCFRTDDASGKREREREKKIAKRNVNENAPIIQNAVKTPTPPHCANCFTFATVGTMSTFDAAQCWRGMKDLSTSLMCFSSCVYLIRVILCGFLSILKAIFPQHLGFQLMIQNPKHERSRFFRIQKLARTRVCSSNKERRLLRTRASQTAKEEEEETVE